MSFGVSVAFGIHSLLGLPRSLSNRTAQLREKKVMQPAHKILRGIAHAFAG